MATYTKSYHTVYHHRYHPVWITTDSTASPTFRAIIAQLAEELGVQIINSVLSSEHIHLFVSIPPHIAVSEFVRRTKGRRSGKIQQELAKK